MDDSDPFILARLRRWDTGPERDFSGEIEDAFTSLRWIEVDFLVETGDVGEVESHGSVWEEAEEKLLKEGFEQ